ncbi:MAG: cation diffusion facilitator family transporter [Cytophagales bacterium]|nr:cation diffusion facilitator family transporter [Cytophagales bacterium]
MGHGHHHHHHHHETGNLKVAFFLNLGFTIIEIIGGLMTNSLAILSDALHDLGDSLSLGLSWYFQELSNKGSTRKFSYGFARFSILGAIINSIVLVVGSIFILIKAIPELWGPEPVNAQGMMLLSILGILVNGAAVLRLKNGDSMNERVVSLHLLEDVLGWTAVLIGSIVMIFVDALWIDPFLSILISAYILFNVYRNLKESLVIVLQGAPQDISIENIHKRLGEISEVCDVHDCHVWSMDGEYHILTVHLQIKEDYRLSELQPLKKQIQEKLAHESIDHVTVEFENEGEDCLNKNCTE